MTEPTCVCPMLKYGTGIDHGSSCAWMAWKRGDVALETTSLAAVSLPLAAISFPIGYNPNWDAYCALKDDIRDHGIKVPIKVTYDQVSKVYRVLDGRARWRAAYNLGIVDVPVVVVV